MEGLADRTACIATVAAALREDSVDLLSRLIVAGGTGAAAVDAVLQDALQAVGCESEMLDYDPRSVPLVDEFAVETVASAARARCLICRLSGQSDARSLLLFAHPDMEEFGAEPGWRSDPFVPRQENGRLYGWGVADDLAGLAIMAQSLAVLRRCGLAPGGDVTLVSAPSKGHRRGIAAALHAGLVADAAVYLHPAESGRGLNEIKAFAPGQLEFTVTVRGRAPATSEPTHTAFAHTGVNPFDKALLIVDALRRLDAERGATVMHSRLQRAIGRSANLMVSNCEYGGEPLSRMPELCRLGGAMTLVPGESLDTVIAAVEAAVRSAAADDAWLSANQPEISWLTGVSAAETPEDAPLYRTVARVLQRFGADPQVNPLHTSSDIRNPTVQKNMPTVGFGPFCGGLTMSGQANEWVDIDSYVQAIAATAAIVMDWCGPSNEKEKGEVHDGRL